MVRPDHDQLIALAERADALVAQGTYATSAGTVDIREAIAECRAGTRLIRPNDWGAMVTTAHRRCAGRGIPAKVQVTGETTLAALRRLTAGYPTGAVAALNFASARNPGGGYRRGALAQEETLARASALVRTLEDCWDYYAVNRDTESLLYTDHAIWSPQVPFFADDEGELLPQPYRAGVITMPAPNNGAIRTEADTLAVPTVFRRRIRQVLALAICEGIEHLVLGAWGCGAFGNHPELVATWFQEALSLDEPLRCGFASLTFAIYETSHRRLCRPAFERLATVTHG